jgi:hypothetical protein
MGGSPIVKPITKVIRKVTKPIVETIKPYFFGLFG